MGSAQVKQFPQPDDPQNDESNSRIASLRSERSPNPWDVADRSHQQERIPDAIPDRDQPNNIRGRQSHTLHSTANIAVPEPDPLLTAEDVAQRLRVTRDWVWDHSSRKAPFLPVIRMGDGTLRYRASRIEEFINQRERLTHLRRKRA
jgi:predicted DNA-binding transcriptional regulator AlpA